LQAHDVAAALSLLTRGYFEGDVLRAIMPCLHQRLTQQTELPIPKLTLKK
jgi:hypothetical protein